jgi:hypothetical protein
VVEGQNDRAALRDEHCAHGCAFAIDAHELLDLVALRLHRDRGRSPGPAHHRHGT